MRKMSLSLFGLTLIVGALAVHAEPQKVYKWVDKNGVTHFSQAAPKGQKADARDMREPPKARDDKVEVAAEPKSARCQQIDANLNVLKNSKVVAMDSDGDGKSENLSDEQRKAQLALAEQQKAAFCSK